jgi:hypothetical protein
MLKLYIFGKGKHETNINFLVKSIKRWLEVKSLLGNIVFGFIIPWVLGIWLYKKHPMIVILIVPIGISAAFLINEPGFNYFWEIKPKYKNVSLSAQPLNFGLYPILASFMIYFIEKGMKPFITILGFTLFITGLEWIALIQNKVKYLNGWNIGWTFCIYLLAFLIIYGYYIILNRNKIKHLL